MSDETPPFIRPAVSIRNVGKTWSPERRASVEALKDLSLDVAPGEFVVLLGPSGCGKSTLLYMIAGLEEANTGTIDCYGAPVTEPSAERGLIFQEASLFPWLSIVDNVAFGLEVRGVSKDIRRAQAAEILRRVGLGDMLDKKPDELSGGMRQRAACARALAMKPKVMLFDEPTSALDPELVGEVLRVLRALAEEGRTMLVVTHEMGFARNVSNRVVFVHQGLVEADGTPDQVFGELKSDRFRQFVSGLHA